MDFLRAVLAVDSMLRNFRLTWKVGKMKHQKDLNQCSRQNIKLSTPEEIPGHIVGRADLTSNQKRIYSQILYSQADAPTAALDGSWLASKLGICRKTVSRAVQRLEELKLLTVLRSYKETNVYSISPYKAKKFFLILHSSLNSRHTGSIMMIKAYLKLRQGRNENAWPHQKTIAADLGLSLRTVKKALATLEYDGILNIDHCNGGIKQYNRYSIAKSLSRVDMRENPSTGTKLHSSQISRVQKSPTKINTFKEFKTLSTPQTSFSKNLSLSNQSGELENRKFRLLSSHHVHKSVALTIASDNRVTVQDIKNAHLNCVSRADGYKLYSPQPGYIVATINQASIEGKAVKLSKAAQAMLAKANRPIGKPMNESQFDAERKRQLAALFASEETLNVNTKIA